MSSPPRPSDYALPCAARTGRASAVFGGMLRRDPGLLDTVLGE